MKFSTPTRVEFAAGAAIYRRARSDSVFLLSLPFVRDRGGQTRYTSESKCISGVAA